MPLHTGNDRDFHAGERIGLAVRIHPAKDDLPLAVSTNSVPFRWQTVPTAIVPSFTPS